MVSRLHLNNGTGSRQTPDYRLYLTFCNKAGRLCHVTHSDINSAVLMEVESLEVWGI